MNTKKNNTSTTAFQFEKIVWMPHSDKVYKIFYFVGYVVVSCFIIWLNWKFVSGFSWEDSVPSPLWWLLPVVFWIPIVRLLHFYFVGEKHRINRNIETIAREGTAVEMTVTEIKKTKVKKYKNKKTACMTFINLAGQEINDYPVDITGNNLPKKDLIGKKFSFIVDPKLEVYPFIVPEHEEDRKNLLYSTSSILKGYPFIFLCLLLIVGYNMFWYHINGIEEMYLTDYISLIMSPLFMTMFLYLLKYIDSFAAREDVLLTFYGVKTVGRFLDRKYVDDEDSYDLVTIEFPLQNGIRRKMSKKFWYNKSNWGYLPNRYNKETGRFEEEDIQVLYLPSKPDIWHIYPMEKKEKEKKLKEDVREPSESL